MVITGCCFLIVGPVSSLGTLPSTSTISWLPVFSSRDVVPLPSVSGTNVTTSVSSAPGPSSVVMPAGAYLGEGLLPVADKLGQKIVKLEFVEMRDLTPETWLLEDEDSKKSVISLPRRRSPPVTDILQWCQCFAALVGVLSQAYPQMVPEFMAYQTTIIKCARDFQGPAWAQYDRAYRRQVAQTKDLRWSKLNPTLYSLCFAGKAKRHVICNFCLSDNHASERCPENLDHVEAVSWPIQSGLLNQILFLIHSHQLRRVKLCHLFNAQEGPRCTFRPCKYVHWCSNCRGAHPLSVCTCRSGSYIWWDL